MHSPSCLSQALLAASVISLGFLAGCPVNQPQDTPVEQRLLTESSTGGSYFLYVPSSYRKEKPAPIIISCHGTDPFDTADRQVREWKMLAEQHGCLLICPKLASTDGILGDGPTTALLRDERLIISILRDLSYRYNLDRRNVLMTGFSGGGFPAYFVGLRHPDIFSVVVARNCNFSQRGLQDWYPMDALRTPIMVYWGENDPGAIRSQSQAAVTFLRSSGFMVDTDEIMGSGHERHPEVAMAFWLRHWNIGNAPLGTPAGGYTSTPPPAYPSGQPTITHIP
jgi:poly(3-hydroxybutyrate) depolymerase